MVGRVCTDESLVLTGKAFWVSVKPLRYEQFAVSFRTFLATSEPPPFQGYTDNTQGRKLGELAEEVYHMPSPAVSSKRKLVVW